MNRCVSCLEEVIIAVLATGESTMTHYNFGSARTPGGFDYRSRCCGLVPVELGLKELCLNRHSFNEDTLMPRFYHAP